MVQRGHILAHPGKNYPVAQVKLLGKGAGGINQLAGADQHQPGVGDAAADPGKNAQQPGMVFLLTKTAHMAKQNFAFLHAKLSAQGGAGGTELAEAVVKLCEEPCDFRFAYGLDGGIEDKLRAVVQRVYRGRDIDVLPEAAAQIDRLTALGMAHMPVCIAKTQYSFSDDKTKLGAPEDFTVTVRQIKVSAGAGFTVALAGNIMTMPGLPSVPAAESIDIDNKGRITGLF